LTPLTKLISIGNISNLSSDMKKIVNNCKNNNINCKLLLLPPPIHGETNKSTDKNILKVIHKPQKSNLNVIPQPIIPSDYDTQSQSQSQPSFSQEIQITNCTNNEKNKKNSKKSKSKNAVIITSSHKTSSQRKKRGVKRKLSLDIPHGEKPHERKKRKKVEQRKLQIKDKRNIARKIILNENDIDVHSLGEMDCICIKCQAKFWKKEGKAKNVFSICCKNQKITLPNLKEPPKFLRELLDNDIDFRNHIRAYNSILAFASLGANIDQKLIEKKGNYCFRIH